MSGLKDNASRYLSKIAGFVAAIPIVQFLEDRKEVDTFDIANELRLDMDVIIKAEGIAGGGQGEVIGGVYHRLEGEQIIIDCKRYRDCLIRKTGDY